MGYCFTIHRNTETTTFSATDMNLKLSPLGSKTMNFVISPSSDKKQPKNRSLDWSNPPSNTIAIGSKDEAFFNSKAFFDSDCEDEFYSVDGDFTPSRGSTPIDNTFGTPSHNKNPFVNRIQGSVYVETPEKKERKTLIDLFRESDEEAKPTIQDVLPKSKLSTSISSTNSVWSSERTSSEDTISSRETSIQPVKSAQFCLPIIVLFSCRSFRERRRKVKSCNSSK